VRADGDTLARYGGDEFVMICRGRPAGYAIRRALARPFLVDGEWVTVGASVGVVTGRRGTDAETLIRRADEAMYAAKRSQPGRPVAAPPSAAIVGTREGVDRARGGPLAAG